MLASDLRSEGRWLSSGLLLMFASGFGQTFYIALFAGDLTGELALSDGQFGMLYTVATLASAGLLTWAGRFADELPTRWLGAGVLLGLAVTSLVMAGAASAWTLALAVFGLRFFGQGMLTHVAMTAMGRWFTRKRGRAVSIAALGLPAAEAVLPLAAVALTGLVGWRSTWAVTGGALAVVLVPVLVVLLAREREPALAASHPSGSASPEPRKRDWTRAEVLRSPLFYALLPGVLANPLVVTGVFFNQVGIAEMKGWALSWWAASFPVLAGTHVLATLASGWLVDRFGAHRLLPIVLAPLGIGTLLLTLAPAAWMLPVFMALAGMAQGGVATAQGALWPEIYGTLHLGAIRAVVVAAVVLSTALAPGVIGVLLDAGVPLESQLMAMAVYTLAAAAWLGLLTPRLRRLAAA